MNTADFFQLFFYPQNWDHQINLIFLLVGFVYLLFTGPLRKKLAHSYYVKGSTKFFFLFALIIYYFSLGSPLNLVAHELFSMHMLQMSLLYFVMPPLMLLGMPSYLLEPMLNVKWIRVIMGFSTRPLITLFMFNGLMSIYHVPVVFDFIMTNNIAHFSSHAILLFSALCMWWPIIAPVSTVDRLKPLHKLALIFANGVLLTPACAMITFTDKILFTTYQQVSQLAPILSPIHDQQFGGVIMKIVQEIVYITAIGLVFIRWTKVQRLKDQEELAESTNIQKGLLIE